MVRGCMHAWKVREASISLIQRKHVARISGKTQEQTAQESLCMHDSRNGIDSRTTVDVPQSTLGLILMWMQHLSFATRAATLAQQTEATRGAGSRPLIPEKGSRG